MRANNTGTFSPSQKIELDSVNSPTLKLFFLSVILFECLVVFTVILFVLLGYKLPLL